MKVTPPIDLIAHIVNEVLCAEADRLSKLGQTVGAEIDSYGDSLFDDRLAELQFKFIEITSALEQVRTIQDEIVTAFKVQDDIVAAFKLPAVMQKVSGRKVARLKTSRSGC